MRMRWAGAVVALALVGCDTTNNNINEIPDLATGASPAPACTPNAKSCVNSTLARVCPSDGSGWLAVPCADGSTCTAGDCIAPSPTPQPCTADDNLCTGDTTALICNASGAGFTMTTCPANTQCVGAGQCYGACLVGDSFCGDLNTQYVCADGLTYTPTVCPSGQACGSSAGACIPADCDPSSSCDAVCGNKSVDKTDTNTAFTSECDETPNGYKWVSVGCVSPKTCDPTAACSNGTGSACTETCTPGGVRCLGGGGSPAMQTCGADGTWGNAVLCPPPKVCVTDVNNVGIGCGDSVCDGVAPTVNGTCAVAGSPPTSEIIPCDVTGNLAAAAVPCAHGVCRSSGNGDGAPGSCTTNCDTNTKSGDSGCHLGNVFTCVNGVYSEPSTPCAAGTQCFQYTDVNTGANKAVCGVCQPGGQNQSPDTRCTNSGGTPSGGASDYEEICQATGQYGPATLCVSSYCPGGPNHCQADCTPGKHYCTGAQANPSPVPARFGKTQVATCPADGNAATAVATNCTAPTSCRNDVNGNAYGCVICVGSGPNEVGSTDTVCNGGGVETCNSNNTTFSAPTTCSGTCHDATNLQCGSCDITVPATQCQGPPGCQGGCPFPACACPSCSFNATQSVHLDTCSNSAIVAAGGTSCAASTQGSPESCGPTSDCCSDDCGTGNITPAYCSVP